MTARKTQPEKLLIRIPASLKQALILQSEIEGVSVNQVIIYLLTKGVGK